MPNQAVLLDLASIIVVDIKTKFYVVLCILFLAPGALWAQTHDGFFLRFQLGNGSGSLDAEIDDEKYKFETSSAGILNFQIGGSINPNWAIHLNLGNVSAANTDTSFRSAEYSVGSTGLGVSYFFLSHNIYISPEYRFDSTAELEIDDKVKYSFSGSGFGFSLGKEWWLSADWGLGVALFYHRDSLKGNKVKTLLTNSKDGTSADHLGFVLSATYN